ncbi:MAG TPA: hypothetical protein DCQ06_06865 [Myxococcales bacterium]|nr:hypothetical protein [Myxococcales bacterium]
MAIAGGYETAVPMWTNLYLNRARKRPGRRYAVNLQTGYDSRLLDRLAVHHYLRRVRDKKLRGWRQVASAGVVALDRNPTPLPRVGFAQQIQIEPSRQQAIKRLERLPLNVTLLQGELLHDTAGVGRVMSSIFGATHLSVQVHCDRPKVLVVRDVLSAGWSAKIDGKPAEMTLADGLFRALPIPAGEHRVEMSYQAPGLRVGVWTSALLWGLWLLLWFAFPKSTAREP